MKKIFIALIVLMNCGGSNHIYTPIFSPGPITWVYKMKADYSNNVPVILSEDKSEIIQYPHPTDLKKGDEFLKPISLKKGYWLDQKGINLTVAFTKYSYEEYALLKEAPSIHDLYAAIIDKSPLDELWNCGNKTLYNSLTDQLNAIIKSGQMEKKCKRLI
jgi:hypothetical protein